MQNRRGEINRSKQGFTLVELMVSVAIVGILTTLVVPMTQNFSARAKQAEAKTLLAAAHGAEVAFYTEYGYYTGCLKEIGFAPVGDRHYYTVGFGWSFIGSDQAPMSTVGSCDTTATGEIQDQSWFQANMGGSLPDVTDIPPDSGVSTNAFLLYAVGNVGFSKGSGFFDPATGLDFWSVDHLKSLRLSNSNGTLALTGASWMGDTFGK